MKVAEMTMGAAGALAAAAEAAVAMMEVEVGAVGLVGSAEEVCTQSSLRKSSSRT